MTQFLQQRFAEMVVDQTIWAPVAYVIFLVLVVVLVSVHRRGHPGRSRLPQRRRSVNYKFEHAGFRWHATVNTEGGAVLEVFLSTAKTGELLEHLSKDMSVAASLALQYGCPLDVLRAALARDTGGEPLTPLARALDLAGAKEGRP